MSIAEGIHLKLRQPLKDVEERTRFASFIASTIDRGEHHQLPRILNEHDTQAYQFQLDQGNDYFLIIDEEDTTIVNVRMRYENTPIRVALLTWIGHRWGGQVIVPEALLHQAEAASAATSQ